MSTDPVVLGHLTPVDPPLTARDLAVVLVKHYGLKEGAYDLMIEYQLGTGAVGPDKEHLLPGVMIGMSRVGLVRSTKPGPTTVDAVEVNPIAKARKRVRG